MLVWVERFFKLWSRNQWKRERYAPSFHLDDHNLDPRTWCRFPILSGGFEKELAEMRDWAAEQKPNSIRKQNWVLDKPFGYRRDAYMRLYTRASNPLATQFR